MEIVNVEGFLVNQVKDFLSEIEAIKYIDDGLINNSVAITDDNEILGVISYEKYAQYGLIRYFVFKKKVDPEYIYELFFQLNEKAKKDGIKKLFSIVVNKEIYELFNTLGFVKVDKDNFFIEEERFLSTKYKESLIMIKDIERSIC